MEVVILKVELLARVSFSVPEKRFTDSFIVFEVIYTCTYFALAFWLVLWGGIN